MLINHVAQTVVHKRKKCKKLAEKRQKKMPRQLLFAVGTRGIKCDCFLLELVICVFVYVILAYTQLFLYYLQLTY